MPVPQFPFCISGLVSNKARTERDKDHPKSDVFNPLNKWNHQKLITLLPGLSPMLRLLLILALAIYILSKIGGFFFRVGAASQNRNAASRRPEGNVHVDPNQKKDKRGTIKGGDYVDYEEVK